MDIEVTSPTFIISTIIMGWPQWEEFDPIHSPTVGPRFVQGNLNNSTYLCHPNWFEEKLDCEGKIELVIALRDASQESEYTHPRSLAPGMGEL